MIPGNSPIKFLQSMLHLWFQATIQSKVEVISKILVIFPWKNLFYFYEIKPLSLPIVKLHLKRNFCETAASNLSNCSSLPQYQLWLTRWKQGYRLYICNWHGSSLLRTRKDSHRVRKNNDFLPVYALRRVVTFLCLILMVSRSTVTKMR